MNRADGINVGFWFQRKMGILSIDRFTTSKAWRFGDANAWTQILSVVKVFMAAGSVYRACEEHHDTSRRDHRRNFEASTLQRPDFTTGCHLPEHLLFCFNIL